MHNLKKTITILLILASMTTIQAQTPQDALSVITTYAEDGNSVPTIADYVDLGMTEIDTHNIDAINDKIATLPQTAIATAAKIQKLIDAHNLMIHAVLNVVTGFILSSDTTPPAVPTLEFSAMSDTNTSTVKVTGEKYTVIYIDGVSTTVMIPASGNITISLSTPEVGTQYTFSFTLKDPEGNESPEKSITIEREIQLNVTYTAGTDPDGDDQVKLSGTVDVGPNKTIEYMMVNGDRVGGGEASINAQSYTFTNFQGFPGTVPLLTIKYQNIAETETYTISNP